MKKIESNQAIEILHKFVRGPDKDEHAVVFIGKVYCLIYNCGASYYNCGANFIPGHIHRVPMSNIKPDLSYRYDEYPQAREIWLCSRNPQYDTSLLVKQKRYGAATKSVIKRLINETRALEEKEFAAGPCGKCGGHIYATNRIEELCLKVKVCLACSRKVRDQLEEDEKRAETLKARIYVEPLLGKAIQEVVVLGQRFEEQSTAYACGYRKYRTWPTLNKIAREFLQMLDHQTITLKEVLCTARRKV